MTLLIQIRRKKSKLIGDPDGLMGELEVTVADDLTDIGQTFAAVNKAEQYAQEKGLHPDDKFEAEYFWNWHYVDWVAVA